MDYNLNILNEKMVLGESCQSSIFCVYVKDNELATTS